MTNWTGKKPKLDKEALVLFEPHQTTVIMDNQLYEVVPHPTLANSTILKAIT